MASETSDRLDRIESALASRLNLNLDEFDGQEIQTARRERLEQAGEQAAQIVKAAFTAEELTADQRLERIERALLSGGSLV